MAKDDAIQAELKELRAQLEAVQARDAASEAGDEPASSTEEGDATDETETVESVHKDLSAQIHDFIERMDHELKDANPSMLLTVFGLGVFTGWLLRR